MATIPSLRTWATGERVTGAKLNELRDAFTFLLDPPAAHIYNAAGVTIGNGSTIRMTCPDTVTDNDSMAQSPGRMRFTTGGRYWLNILVTMPAAAYTDLSLNLRLNSGGSSTGGTSLRTWPLDLSSQTINIGLERDFVAGDYVEPYISQTSGASRTTSGTTLGCAIQARFVTI